MNFDEIIVKESPGLCRCCLSEGCYKDLGKEHSWMGETEVYADILLECFDISISQHNEGPNGANRLICEVCITRLRDACNFKKQVQESEKKFVDMVGRGEFKPKVHIIYQPPLKAEEVEAEEAPGDADVEYLDEDIDFGDVDESVSRAAPARKRGRPRKGEPKPPRKLAKLVKAEEKTKSSKQMPKEYRIREQCEPPRRKRLMYRVMREPKIEDSNDQTYPPTVQQQIFRINVQNVLESSTVMPFKWLKNAYRCFYCFDVFYEPGHFKNHQKKHSGSEIGKAVANHWDSTLYVDVSKIACKMCPDTIDDFAHLIDHLTSKHEMPFKKDMANIHPFLLHNLSATCVVCSRSYRSFSSLLTHWDREHRSTSEYLCDICGKSSPNLGDLREHKAKEHKNREVKCNQCNVMCTVSTMRTHRQRYHNKMYKCFYCPELFATHYKRNSHLIVVHKNKEAARCPHCPKTFVYRSTMNRHVRECHLQEKNAVCGVCGFKAFGGHRLQRHMMKHSDVRDFQCAACGKAFKTKKTLKQHYLSIHEKGKVQETPLLALL